SLPRYVAYGDAYVNNQSFGVPHPEALKGFTHYNIAFWVSTSGGVDNVQAWMQASETVRKAIVNAYNNAGIRLGMSVFGETDSPLANGDNPYHLADQIADFVEQYNLQGVDVDFEEYDAFENRIATKWVIPLTRRLRARLPQNQYYLSHAPVAPLFNTDLYPLGYTWIEQDIGNLIDFYNIQFYNQDDYSTCHTLLLRSGTEWPNTSLIQLNQVYNIPFEKMIVGKPATAQDADNGYIDPHKLAVCIANFAVPAGWRSGCMWWEFAGDIQTNLVPVLELAGL
ncbi:glycoside hydrolase, partial [Meira miltonrushii]